MNSSDGWADRPDVVVDEENAAVGGLLDGNVAAKNIANIQVQNTVKRICTNVKTRKNIIDLNQDIFLSHENNLSEVIGNHNADELMGSTNLEPVASHCDLALAGVVAEKDPDTKTSVDELYLKDQ